MDTAGICGELNIRIHELLMLIRYTKNNFLLESWCILKVRKLLDCGLLRRYRTYLIKRKVRWVICIYNFVVGFKKIIYYLKLRTKHIYSTFQPKFLVMKAALPLINHHTD
jgi:hypothetical protein